MRSLTLNTCCLLVESTAPEGAACTNVSDEAEEAAVDPTNELL